jgi:predicted DNA-binding ribbon-helix-helix protein
MNKRSLSIAGHRTSIALEPEFWTALEEIARHRSLSLAQLIREIDETRTTTNLSSAVRIAVLRWYRVPSPSS